MEIVKRWISITSRKAAWAPILVFGLHVIISQLFDAYLIFPSLDIPMHFLGGVAIAYFFLHAVTIAGTLEMLGAPNRVFILILVFALSCSSTVFWEFAEFLFDRYLGAHTQVSLADTLGDMLMGIVGACVLLSVPQFRIARFYGKLT